ncbi:hypothetical protein [Aliidiomarina maris]|uniref:Uncharacterized protein n=1 Tax=Aliidiomarina maris TaxID=531312 RepID=A0A327X5U2_9GAMM|nr:hypothetical protein [Aliidiomarina maris]RAK01608.1 hypothetical protein B0I24_101231 [Aliidiomarina maris]RUO28434.1 hypothetical protein CWE07_01105 [Aliidiomarina maris]
MSNTINHRSSKADMLKYGMEELGVKLDDSKDRSEIWAELKEIDKSLAANSEATPTGEGNLTQDTDTSSQPNSSDIGSANIKQDKKPTSDAAPKRPARVLINIHQPPGSDDPEFEPDTHVVVGVNGTNYQLEIGKDLPVPFGVYDVLRNAKQKKYYRRKAAGGEMETICKEVLRHPFTIIKELY